MAIRRFGATTSRTRDTRDDRRPMIYPSTLRHSLVRSNERDDIATGRETPIIRGILDAGCCDARASDSARGSRRAVRRSFPRRNS